MSVKRRAYLVGIIMLTLLIISIIAICVMKSNTENGAVAYLYQDNIVIKKIDLSQVEEPYELRVEAKNGGYNIVRVEKGKIGVVEASCPDLLCKNVGFISNSLLPVTCLPNHLVIVIENNEKVDLDDIAY